jgi:hypothetical protein
MTTLCAPPVISHWFSCAQCISTGDIVMNGAQQ